MQRPITLVLALAVLAGLGSQATAQNITIVKGQKAAKTKRGISLAASNGDIVAPKAKKRQAGQVLLSVKNADLVKTVLPMFEAQAGVKIKWRGPSKLVSLRLVQPVDWENALELVCQFTNTHATTNTRGEIVLKRTWAGFVNDEKYWDDLGGQVKVPQHLRRTSMLASAKRSGKRMPVTRKRNPIPTIRLGGGTLSFNNPRARPAQPYVSRRPNVANLRPIANRRAANPQPGFGS